MGNLGSTLPFDLNSAYEKKRLERLAEEEKEKKRREEIEFGQYCHRLWVNSNVPARHSNFSIPESGPWSDAFASINSKVGSGILFVIMGLRGTGKTQLGTSLIKDACAKGLKAKYTKAIDVFIDLRGSFRKDGQSESDVIDRYIEPSLLVVDALEERGETTFEDRLLNHIIDKRYDAMYDTVLITNQNTEKFQESVGPSIVSRIHETGDKLVCDWQSFRTRK